MILVIVVYPSTNYEYHCRLHRGSPPQFVLFGKLLKNKDCDNHNAHIYLYPCTYSKLYDCRVKCRQEPNLMFLKNFYKILAGTPRPTCTLCTHPCIHIPSPPPKKKFSMKPFACSYIPSPEKKILYETLAGSSVITAT